MLGARASAEDEDAGELDGHGEVSGDCGARLGWPHPALSRDTHNVASPALPPLPQWGETGREGGVWGKGQPFLIRPYHSLLRDGAVHTTHFLGMGRAHLAVFRSVSFSSLAARSARRSFMICQGATWCGGVSGRVRRRPLTRRVHLVRGEGRDLSG